jgi:3-hydroxymyristoyl/3-hydroxydecanoyl-(acyl carrier protein) dehydratase
MVDPPTGQEDFLNTTCLLPEVLDAKIQDHELLLDLRIPENLAYFSGHFTRIAVVPGVVQIHWAVHFARHYLAWPGVFRHMEAVKFKELLLPGRHLRLKVQAAPEKARLQFVFYSEDQEYSSGRVYFHPGDA